MENSNNNEAYLKGFDSVLYNNPYPVGSAEYNECERGWAQRFRRNSTRTSLAKKKKPKTFQELYTKK